MIENVEGLRVKGACFKEATDFNFFKAGGKKIAKGRLALVYGRNGSGKTTLSKAFHALKSGDLAVETTLIGDGVNCYEAYEKIHVFNESFVDNNVRINGEGLESIVLFGEQLDIDEEIKKCETRVAELNKAYEAKLETGKLLRKRFDADEVCLRDMIRNGYGLRYLDLNECEFRLVKSRFEHLIERSLPNLTIDQLRKEYEFHYEAYKKTSKNNCKFERVVREVGYSIESFEKLKRNLETVIKRNSLSDRERLIYETMLSQSDSYVERAKKNFENNSSGYCPFCFQRVTEEYRRELLSSIENVLNKEADNLKKEIALFTFPNVYVDMPYLRKIDHYHADSVNDLLEKYDREKEKCRYLIDKKLDNIFNAIAFSYSKITFLINEMNKHLCKIEESRRGLVAAMEGRVKTLEKLNEINKDICRLEIDVSLKTYVKSYEVLEKERAAFRAIQKQQEDLEAKLKSLNSQKANIKIALGEINDALDFIFLNEDRLKVKEEEGRYVLFSRGRRVKPEEISLGERNVLALCYFFTKLREGLDASDGFSRENLVVLDDPVSSFDLNNKAGIYSFLKSCASRVMNGNKNSKMLIMTHDAVTMDTLNVALNGVVDKGCMLRFLLEPKGLVVSDRKCLCEYENLLKRVYDYAVSDDFRDEDIIGNVARRVLEAYSNFFMNSSVKNVVSNLPKEMSEYRVYFQKRLMTLFLNQTSHTELPVKDLWGQLSYLSCEEKQRLCRDVLCLFYLATPGHVEAYVEGSEKRIKTWLHSVS